MAGTSSGRDGVSDTFGPTPQGIDFTACVQCGQCITGCPYGAKATTADTYLSEAQRLGAEIRPNESPVPVTSRRRRARLEGGLRRSVAPQSGVGDHRP